MTAFTSYCSGILSGWYHPTLENHSYSWTSLSGRTGSTLPESLPSRRCNSRRGIRMDLPPSGALRRLPSASRRRIVRVDTPRHSASSSMVRNCGSALIAAAPPRLRCQDSGVLMLKRRYKRLARRLPRQGHNQRAQHVAIHTDLSRRTCGLLRRTWLGDARHAAPLPYCVALGGSGPGESLNLF